MPLCTHIYLHLNVKCGPPREQIIAAMRYSKLSNKSWHLNGSVTNVKKKKSLVPDKDYIKGVENTSALIVDAFHSQSCHTRRSVSN